MSIQIKSYQTSIRTIKPSDPKFIINDGLRTATRAGFEINSKCPYSYRTVIEECIRNGWLKPIAHVKDSELFWEELQR